MQQHFLLWLIYVVVALTYMSQTVTTDNVPDKPSSSKLDSDTTDSDVPLVILVGFDGFRFDYLDLGITPTLKKFADEGVLADSLQPCFPSKTLANFFSISTGLYPGRHGVLGAASFHNGQCVHYSQKLYDYDKKVTPLWTFNELAHGPKKSGTMMWSGGEFEFRGRKLEYFETLKFDKWGELWATRVDKALDEWMLNKENPANLIMMYFEQPDNISHRPGIEHEDFTKIMIKVDELFAYFLKRLEETGLDKKADVIVVSDHGMAVTTPENFVDISFLFDQVNRTMPLSILDKRLKTCDYDPVIQFASDVPEVHERVHNQLKEICKETKWCYVCTHENIPKKWLLDECSRVKDTIVLVAKFRGGFLDGQFVPRPSSHGWNNYERQMDGFFAARGPHIRKKHFINKQLRNIDIFGLVSYILELDPDLLLMNPDSYFGDIQEALEENFLANETPLRRKIREYFTEQNKLGTLQIKERKNDPKVEECVML